MIKFDKEDRHIVYVWNGFEELKIVNIHDRTACGGRVCVIHSPTEHHMSEWPLTWYENQALFYRTCPHQRRVLDPDQFQFLRESGKWADVKETCCGYIYSTAGPTITCTSCGDQIQSLHRHDFVTCTCGDTSIDGGSSYTRIVGQVAA